MTGKPFLTDEEIKERISFIKDRKEEGKTWATIGDELGIKGWNVESFWRRHAKEEKVRYALITKNNERSRPKPVIVFQERNCMTCRKPFRSEGSHNRMCSPCKLESHSTMGI
jgi:hypothetical protein